MKPVFMGVVALSLISSASTHGETLPNAVNVLYSLSVSQNDVVELSVYNPTDHSACTSYLNWPGASENFRVVGQDGKEWEYIGLAADPIGRPEDVKIAPHSEVTLTLDLRKNYKPLSSDAHIGKVYYGANFHSC